MKKILITEFMDQAWVDWLGKRAEVIYQPDLPDRPDALLSLAQGVDALIVRNRTQVSGGLLDAGFSCVGRLGVGLDNIDMKACRKAKIEVFPAHGANTASVAEYVISSAMMLLRGAFMMRPQMEQGAWPRGVAGQGREIAGKTLGLIGYGAIARVTADKAHALGMAVVAFDPHLSDDNQAWGDTISLPLESLLKTADVVSLHVPLTEDTHHLINAARLAKMKKGAILINAARGGVVDEGALCEALHEGHLSGAALDVFEQEPMTQDHPFKDVPNLILTPHIGGVTAEANTRVSKMTAQSVARHLKLDMKI